MRNPKWMFNPAGPMVISAHEANRTVTQMLETAAEMALEAAELRACAIEFEAGAATLREVAARQQARMQSDVLKVAASEDADGMVAAPSDVPNFDIISTGERFPRSRKPRFKPIVLKKDKGARRRRKGKKKHAMKTRSQQMKTTGPGARPEWIDAEEKRQQHKVDLINDPILRPLIAPSQEQIVIWLATRKSRFPREATAGCSKAYILPPGELPMMSGGVLTSTDQLNVDNSHLLKIETHIHLRSKEQDAAENRRNQFITAEEDRIDGMLTDNDLPSSESEERACLDEEETFVPQYVKERGMQVPVSDDVSLQEEYYDSEGENNPYTSQIGNSLRRLANDLLWDVD